MIVVWSVILYVFCQKIMIFFLWENNFPRVKFVRDPIFYWYIIFEFSFVCHGKIGVVHNKLGILIIYKLLLILDGMEWKID